MDFPADRLLFAIPKKGRLHERCLALLKTIDVQFHRKPRHDIALARNLPVAIVFLPAADIASYVGEGNVDIGITGWDIVCESGEQDKVVEELKLGFGKCRLVVQVPIKGEIQRAEELAGKRVVTSFENLTRAYFNNIDEAALNEEEHDVRVKTRIRFVSGSVEAACALGLADGIGTLLL